MPRSPSRRPPRSRDEVLDEGEALFYEGDYEGALARFEEAVSLDEDDAEAQYLRGRSLFYLGRDEDAESAFDRSLDLAPDFAPALIHKAELFVRALGWPEDALDLLEEAEALGLNRDDQIEASFVRGLALMEQGDYRRALEPLNRALRGDPDWAEALRERGICRFYLWRFEDALRDLEKTIVLDGSDSEAQYFLGMVLERLGRDAEAGRAYELAASLDPHGSHVPFRATREEFQRALAEALEDLPEDFRLRFDSLRVGVQGLPTKDLGVYPDACGACPGESSPEHGHPMLGPCRVILFQANLERVSPDLAALKDEIGKTILHEVGHRFGLPDDEAAELRVH